MKNAHLILIVAMVAQALAGVLQFVPITPKGVQCPTVNLARKATTTFVQCHCAEKKAQKATSDSFMAETVSLDHFEVVDIRFCVSQIVFLLVHLNESQYTGPSGPPPTPPPSFS